MSGPKLYKMFRTDLDVFLKDNTKVYTQCYEGFVKFLETHNPELANLFKIYYNCAYHPAENMVQ